MLKTNLFKATVSGVLFGWFAASCAVPGDGSASHFIMCHADAQCDGGECTDGRCAAARTPTDGGRDAAHDTRRDATVAEPRDASLDATSPTLEQPSNCVLKNTSTIPHVHVEFPSKVCAFTLAQAKAGITFPYRIVIDEDVPGYVSSGGYTRDNVGGLQVDIAIEGGSQRYCLCDQGPEPPACALGDGGFSFPGAGPCHPITVEKAAYEVTWPRLIEEGQTHSWDGRNWDGPSDTSTPEGAPFPPGDYALKIAINGSLASDAGVKDVGIDAEFLVRLVK